MVPLTIGQTVTYVDPSGTQHVATVIEPYGFGALVNVPDLALNIACRRMTFEGTTAQPGPRGAKRRERASAIQTIIDAAGADLEPSVAEWKIAKRA